MQVGEIIKFHREQAGLTQAMLGEGICTTTHVSKIERGKTAYSDEIILMFSNRLKIDIQKEVMQLQQLERKLEQWHSAMIMQRDNLREEMNQELNETLIIPSSKYAARYYLLKTLYYIQNQDMKNSHKWLKYVENHYTDLSPFDGNLFHHVKGIYYIMNPIYRSHQKAVDELKEIDHLEYRNKEFYYHLAIAYYGIGSKVTAFYYAEKALRHFKATNNYIQALKTESLMLLQLSGDLHIEISEITERYERLIVAAEGLGISEQKGQLLNNLGYEYYIRNDYSSAKKYFLQALKIADKHSNDYLTRYYNYLDSCIEEQVMKKTTLHREVKVGKALAKESNISLYQILFKILQLRLEQPSNHYYNYLEKVALPYFQTEKNLLLLKRYQNVLYEYYIKNKEYQKAVSLSERQFTLPTS